jgi:hypothetical protein
MVLLLLLAAGCTRPLFPMLLLLLLLLLLLHGRVPPAPALGAVAAAQPDDLRSLAYTSWFTYGETAAHRSSRCNACCRHAWQYISINACQIAKHDGGDMFVVLCDEYRTLGHELA